MPEAIALFLSSLIYCTVHGKILALPKIGSHAKRISFLSGELALLSKELAQLSGELTLLLKELAILLEGLALLPEKSAFLPREPYLLASLLIRT